MFKTTNLRKFLPAFARERNKRHAHNRCRETDIFDVRNKVAFVVGGTNGIGLAVSSEIIKAGAKHVVVASNDKCLCANAVKRLNVKYGHDKSSAFTFDVRDDRRFSAAFERIRERHGQLDVYVNSVGYMDGSNWQDEISINLTSMVRGSFLAVQNMSRATGGGGGVIINVSGTMGMDPMPGAANLAATKHAVVGFCRSLGEEAFEKESGLRVMTLCPGITHTGRAQCFAQNPVCDPAGRLQRYYEQARKQKPQCCGQAAVHLMKRGRTGSVWVIEGYNLYLVDIPSYKTNSSLQVIYC